MSAPNVIVNYKLEEGLANKIVGKKVHLKERKEIKGFWEEMMNEGLLEELSMIDEMAPLLGISYNYDVVSKEFDYMIGIACSIDEHEVLDELFLEKEDYVKVEIKGKMPYAIQKVLAYTFNDLLKEMDVEANGKPMIEIYPYGETNSDQYESQLWVPVKK